MWARLWAPEISRRPLLATSAQPMERRTLPGHLTQRQAGPAPTFPAPWTNSPATGSVPQMPLPLTPQARRQRPPPPPPPLRGRPRPGNPVVRTACTGTAVAAYVKKVRPWDQGLSQGGPREQGCKDPSRLTLIVTTPAHLMHHPFTPTWGRGQVLAGCCPPSSARRARHPSPLPDWRHLRTGLTRPCPSRPCGGLAKGRHHHLGPGGYP